MQPESLGAHAIVHDGAGRIARRDSIPREMAKTAPSRISGQKILADLRLAAKKGDRAALSLALDQMRTLAHSPKYWEKYLTLLRNPLARLVDMLLIKQGERIAHQKGWKLPKPSPVSEKPRRPMTRAARARAVRARTAAAAAARQISLFE
jgi:hypothetical protein